MSDVAASSPVITAIDQALAAAFGGTIPPVLDALIDRAAVTKFDSTHRIGFSFALGEDGAAERPLVRIVCADGDFHARVKAQWPAAGPFFERWPQASFSVETDGTSLRLLVVGAGFAAPAGAPAGLMAPGGFVFLPEGTVEAFTPVDGAPLDRMDATLRAEASKIADAGLGGIWFCRWTGDKVHFASWNTDGPRLAGLEPWIRAQPLGSRARAVLEALDSSGMEVDPYGIDIEAGKAPMISFWGLRDRIQPAWNAPDIFTRGQAPDANAFADALGEAVIDADRGTVADTVRTHLFPALTATVPAGTDPAEHFRSAFAWIYERLAEAVPLQRADFVRAVSLQAHLSALDDEAWQLGLARYALLHPQSDAAQDLLPAYTGLDVVSLRARAGEKLALVEAIAAELAPLPHLDERRYEALPVNLPATRDTLQRAISGDFTAAMGRLNEFLLGAGPGGFDDDPNLGSLDSIDLDAAASRAAIEKALADDE